MLTSPWPSGCSLSLQRWQVAGRDRACEVRAQQAGDPPAERKRGADDGELQQAGGKQQPLEQVAGGFQWLRHRGQALRSGISWLSRRAIWSLSISLRFLSRRICTW